MTIVFFAEFTTISAEDIKTLVDTEYANGRYLLDPLIQLNSNYKEGNLFKSYAKKGFTS